MRWTTEKPTVPGWYWWRKTATARARIVDVLSDREGLYAEGWKMMAMTWNGEWAGPILPPEEAQP
jgi:hypothetical protein